MANMNIFIAFIAGIFSVFSPCIIAVLPGFFAYFSGLTIEHALDKHSRQKIIISTLFFALGFNLVFFTFGLLIGGLSQFLIINQQLLQKICGILIVCFGLLQTGLIKFKTLQIEHRSNFSKIYLPHYLKSLLFGIFFAFSWTPCFGPVIGAIFTLAASSQTYSQSLLLASFYALGFTIPLIILSFSLSYFHKFFKNHRHLYRYSSFIAGVLLIIIGILMFTNSLPAIVNWLNFIYTKNNLSL